MTDWLNLLPTLPVAIPLVSGALMLLLKESHRFARATLALLSVVLQLAVAIGLLGLTAGVVQGFWPEGVGVSLIGDWPAPFGIVVVADRLAAIMLTLSAVLGAATLVYSMARWERAGVHFHPLFQLLLMGLNGAFLTGDLFNLFVFFEVLLAASYGLMLHGSGGARVAAGLHYIAVNLVASFLLLLSIALIYGVTNTLNMADLAVQAGRLTGPDRRIFEAAAAMLGLAFLIKAAAWPLNFWLPAAYANACAPVAAVFAVMTKVGIYALLRFGSLLLPTGAPAAFGGAWMFPIGLATLAFGTLGLLAAQQTERLAGYCIIVSSGTLLTALGMPGVTLTGPALYYLVSSVLALGAFFMLIEMIDRTQPFGADVLAVSLEAFELEDTEASDQPDDVIGVAIPAAMAYLGITFIICTLVMTGLPPLSGFVAKFAILSAALHTSEIDVSQVNSWLLVIIVLISGMAGTIALSRTGIRLFWSQEDPIVPRLRVIEAAPVAALLLGCIALTIWAGPVMVYLHGAAHSLDRPESYINAVLSQKTVRPLAPQATP